MVPGGVRLERAPARGGLTRRRAPLIASLAGLSLLLAACGGGDDEVKAQSTTTTTTTSTTTTTPPSTSPPVTVGIICSTPDQAAMALVDAWKAGDQAAAARCATPAAVSTMFQTNGAGAQWTFQGCGGPDPGVPQCQYSYEGGAATFTLNGTEAAGWKVVNVGFVAD